MKIILKWIFGIGCVLFGLIAFETSIIGGFFFLIAGAFLIPPIFNKINRSRKINRILKIVIPIVGIFTGFIAVGVSASEEVDSAMQKNMEREKEEYAKLTTAQKDSIIIVERISDSIKVEERKKVVELKRQNEIQVQKNNTISARNLYARYEANEVRADESFKNKTFYVTGIVEEIKKDFMGDIYVTLKTGQMFSYVNCYFDDKKVAAKLKKRQRVTFRGKCKGMVVTLVTMEDCEMVDNIQ